FLRSTGSLIQTIGRAARHVNGKATLYADVMTDSIRRAMDETNRRRAKQVAYNEANGITPESIIKPVDMSLVQISEADYATVSLEVPDEELATREQVDAAIAELEKQMKEAAKQFEFEKAATLRDRIRTLKTKDL